MFLHDYSEVANKCVHHIKNVELIYLWEIYLTGVFVLCQTNNKIAIFWILTFSMGATEAYRGIRLSFGPRLQLEKRTCSPGGRVVADDAGRKKMNRTMLTIIANTYFLRIARGCL